MRGAIALLLTAGQALACPGPADLQTGITLRSDVYTTTYRQAGPGVVQSTVRANDGAFAAVTDLAFGLIPLATRATFADPMIPDQDTAYDLTAAGLADRLPPRPGATFALATRVTDQITGQSEAVVITVTAGQPGDVRIGDCVLAGLPVSVLFERPGHWYRAETMVLSDLGLSYVARQTVAGLPEQLIRPLEIAAE